DPIEPAVINVTRFHAGTANNVVPTTAMLNATIRTFSGDVRETVERRIREVCAGLAAAYGVKIDIEYRHGCSPVVNTERECDVALAVAGQIVGEENVNQGVPPTTGGEDFAEMLEQRPGAMVWLGAAREGPY